MSVKINDRYVSKFITKEERDKARALLNIADRKIVERCGEGNEFLGWYDLPYTYDHDEVARIIAAAENIKKDSDILLVIGIGGSYLGARAAIEFLKSPYYNSKNKGTPDIYYIGNSFSSDDICDVLALCENKNVSVNVISKSGTTTESSIAFRLVRKMLSEKYTNDEMQKRMYITTDKHKGALKEFAMRERIDTFTIPNDIGGRFSVLTPVGLLPIAVCGADIKKLLKGAQELKAAYDGNNSNDAYKYAMLRNIFYNQGKFTEILCGYEPSLRYVAEWWKQLFGESEGKDGKGIFPTSLIFSTDLHSLGQYIQDGRRDIFETVLKQEHAANEIHVPSSPVDIDGLNFLAGEKLSSINNQAFLGTMLSHTDGGVPNIIIEYTRRDEENLGELIYFFSLACAASGYMLGVNPFNQPGVEGYKRNMFALLGKPGFEEIKAELLSKLNKI